MSTTTRVTRDAQGDTYAVTTTTDHPAKKTEADYAGVDSLGKLLDSVPELRNLVNEAISQGWSQSRFQNQVEDSDWFRSHSQTARQAIIQRANDPKSWTQSLNNTTNSIVSLSKQLGFTVNEATARAIANSALLTGNDNNQSWLTQQLGRHENYNNIKDTGSLSGNMAATAQQIQSLAAEYGYNLTASQVATRAQQVVEGNTTVDTYKGRLISWAKSAFPGLAKDIEQGATVKDLADPYVTSMSQLLEVDPGTLNVFTPAIRRAMQGVVDPKTKERAPVSLSDFEDQVRQDPRWQYTQNAKDTMSTALLKIGADFGFGPQG